MHTYKKFFLAAVFVLFSVFLIPSAQPALGFSWSNHTGASGSHTWASVASDSTGKRLVAADESGYIYTTSNYGVTWTTNSNSSGARAWRGVASDSTGKYLAASEADGYIYTSNNYGVSWTTNSNSSGLHNWTGVTSNGTGDYLFAFENDGSSSHIYVSSTYGRTWTLTSSTILGGRWSSVASSSTGQYLAAAANGLTIFTSSDRGVTWSNMRLYSTGNHWTSVASDASGVYLAAADRGGYIYTSNNRGVSWTTNHEASGLHDWVSIASSANGQYLVAAEENGYIYTSNNYGVTWTTETVRGYWRSVASSVDGQHPSVAIGFGAPGYVWTIAPSVVTVSASSVTPTSELLTGNLLSLGSGLSSEVSFEYDLGASGTTYANHTPAVSVSATGTFTATISTLTCGGTAYHYRAKTVSAGDTAYGIDRSFTTPTCLPAPSFARMLGIALAPSTYSILGESTPITLTGRLETLDGLGGPDTISFEIARPYDTVYTPIPRGPMTEPGTFTGYVTLPCGMYRVHTKAFNPLDPAHTTSTEPYVAGISKMADNNDWVMNPICTTTGPRTEVVSAVPSRTSAVLTAKLTSSGAGFPNKAFFGYGLPYGTGAAIYYKAFTGPITMTSLREFSTTLTGLTCGTSYRYIVGADDGKIASPSAVGNFDTLACSAPSVATTSATAVTATTASLKGNLTTLGGVSADVSFEYDLASSGTTYSLHTSPVTVSATGAFTAPVSGLACGKEYHFRAKATNTAASAYGTSVSFATLACGGGTTTLHTDSGSSSTSTSTSSSTTKTDGGTTTTTKTTTGSVGGTNPKGTLGVTYSAQNCAVSFPAGVATGVSVSSAGGDVCKVSVTNPTMRNLAQYMAKIFAGRQAPAAN